MIFDLIYLAFLFSLGRKDLRQRQIKNWQLGFFALFLLLELAFRQHFTYLVLLHIVGVFLLTGLAYLHSMLGAGDVKVLALAVLHNFYLYHPWWVLITGLLTALIDLGLWQIHFKKRNEHSPLLFSWFLANLFFFLWQGTQLLFHQQAFIK